MTGLALLACLALGGKTACAVTFGSAHGSDGIALARGALAVELGTRAGGLGQAYTALADDASALCWNPAGLGLIRRLQVTGESERMEWVKVLDGAAALPTPWGTIAADYAMLDAGSYTVRDAAGRNRGDELLAAYRGDAGWGFANPRWLGGKGWTGVGVEFADDAVGGSLVGANLGELWPLGSRWRAGSALTHLGVSDGGALLPATAAAGLAFNPLGAHWCAADVAYGILDGWMRLAGGVEVVNLDVLILRAGAWWRTGGGGSGGSAGYTWGLGIRFWRMSFDLAGMSSEGLAGRTRVALTYGVR